jgi:hypothetical protein
MLAAIASDWWWPKAKRARETGQENGQTGNQKCTVSPSFLPSSSPCFVRKPTYALYQGFTLITCNSMVRGETRDNAPEQAVVPAEQAGTQLVRDVVGAGGASVVGAGDAPPVSKVKGFSASSLQRIIFLY